MKPVIIAGGGVGGMTLAHALMKAKVPFLLLEQASHFRRAGGGIGLWGPALKALKQLDLESKLNGKYMSCAGYRKDNQISDGKWLVRPAGKPERHTSCLCLPRGHLQEVLYENLDQSKILFDSKVVSFSDSEGDAVRVQLEDGREVAGSMLIGADGIHSTIRKQLFPEVSATPCGYHYWQGMGNLDATTVEVGYSPSDDSIPAYEAWGEGIRFGAVPLPNYRNFWFVCSDKKLDKDSLPDAVKEFGSSTVAMIESTPSDDVRCHELRDIRMPKSYGNGWGSGRVVCLGDAVHAMAPNLAQGACLAIEDALELAHQLHHLRCSSLQTSELSQTVIADSFVRYYQSRQRRTAVVQFLVPLVHEMGSLSSPLLVIIRDNVFKLFPDALKTFVFDYTHKWALGWSYTPPNLGQGLYHRLLGAEFMRKNISLSKFHQDDVDRYCRGKVDVTHGSSFLAGCLRFLMQLPGAMQNGDVNLRVTTLADGSEIWRRTFTSVDGQQYYFNTLQDCQEENLREIFGPLRRPYCQ